MFFREKLPPPRLAAREAPRSPREESADGGVEGGAPGGVMGGVVAPEAIPAPSATRPKTANDYAATGIGERTAFPVEWVNFQADPSTAARVAIRYEFHEQLVRLGVLPRKCDGLAAREHARGFEPAYAPDPGAAR